MSLKTLSSILVLSLTILVQVHCQNLCQFRNSVEEPTKQWSFLENLSTRRCLRVENFGHFPNRKLLLDECSYWKTPLREQKIYMESSPLGGFNLKVDAGMGEIYCLTTKSGVLHNALCNTKNFDQTWRFKPVKGQANQYLVEQYSSKYCLIPTGRVTGSPVSLAPCNSYETEQIWKVCTAKQ
jgi:hypothetical protein